MDPATIAALIAAATAAAGAGTNAIATGKMNKKNRNFSREMFAKQNEQNLKNWQQNNEYNSPTAQMARYQEAGLNPNLIYGSGGSAGNSNYAPSAPFQTPKQDTPQWGDVISSAGKEGLSAYYDTQIKKHTVDNLKTQNTVLANEASLKAIQGEREAFDLNLKRGLEGNSLEVAKEKLRQLQTDIDISIDKNAREAAMNSQSIEESLDRMRNNASQRGVNKKTIEKMDSEIQNIKNTGVLQNLDIELKRMGLQPTDSLWQRLVGRFLSTFGEDIIQGIDKEDFNKPFKN